MNHPTNHPSGPATAAPATGRPLTAGQADRLVALVDALSLAALARGRVLAVGGEAERDAAYSVWMAALGAVYDEIRGLEDDATAPATGAAAARYRAWHGQMIAAGTDRSDAVASLVEAASLSLGSDAVLGAVVRAVAAADAEQDTREADGDTCVCRACVADRLVELAELDQAGEEDQDDAGRSVEGPVIFRCWAKGCTEPTVVPSVYCQQHRQAAADLWEATHGERPVTLAVDEVQGHLAGDDACRPVEVLHCMGCGLRYGHAKGCREAARDGGHVSAGMAAAVASVTLGLTSVVALVAGQSDTGAYFGAAAAALGFWSLRHGGRDGGAR